MPTAQHILSFAQTFRGGGVERALLSLARDWIAAGRRVTILVGSNVGPLTAELPAGVELVELGSDRYLAMLRAAPDAVRRLRPDVLFCPGNHYSAVAIWCRVRLGADCPPVVAKVSNALVRPDMGRATALGYRRWLALHGRYLDAAVAMSPAMAVEAAAAMRLPADRIAVIANPRPMVRQGMAVALPQARYLIGVGRLAPQKRWERAIDALARLADRSVELVILGEGERRAALEAHARSLGLGARVHLPGYAADPGPAIAGAAALVLTSDFEGVPGVLREALALGTPVVTTDSSVAIADLVGGAENGSIVPRDDGDALVAAIEHWLAPGRTRPAPRAESGDPARDYLAFFDQLAGAGVSSSSS